MIRQNQMFKNIRQKVNLKKTTTLRQLQKITIFQMKKKRKKAVYARNKHKNIPNKKK